MVQQRGSIGLIKEQSEVRLVSAKDRNVTTLDCSIEGVEYFTKFTEHCNVHVGCDRTDEMRCEGETVICDVSERGENLMIMKTEVRKSGQLYVT